MCADLNNFTLSHSYDRIEKLMLRKCKCLDIAQVGFNQFPIKDITLVMNNILHVLLIAKQFIKFIKCVSFYSSQQFVF